MEFPVDRIAQRSSRDFCLCFRLSTPIMNGDDGGIFLALSALTFCIPRAGSERSQLINIKIATPKFMQTESRARSEREEP